MALENQSAARSTGKVSWFSDSRGYGFITPDEEGDELFVHQSSILSDGFRSLTLGDSVEFAIGQGSDGKTKAVDVTAPGGASLNKKERSSRRNGSRRGGDCFNCGEAGHIAKDCSGERVAGKEVCYTCGEAGHYSRDCVQKLDGNVGGGGGGGACFTCGGFGHKARDCATKKQAGACYECKGIGHLARDCDRRGGGGGKCFKCGEEGHFSRDCSVSA
ncbi:unnamed protein product [Cochlearia groenlandica]